MIIGLTGYAGSGKDTVAEILVKEHGYRRYAFADYLKAKAYDVNLPLREIVDEYGWESAKRNHPHVRECLQKMGIWYRENISEDFWVAVVRNAWLQDGRPPAVITDVRFPNEARFVREYSGSVVRIHRPGVGPANSHISEHLDLAAEASLLNLGSLEDLEVRVSELLTETERGIAA